MSDEQRRTVFVLQHARPEDNGDEDVKLIGVYSGRAPAEAAISRLRRQCGFAEWPDEFHVDSYELDVDHRTEGFGVPWPPTV